MTVIVFAMARANWIFGDLTWVSMVALPLAGVVFQYYTRRTWLTASGCVVLFVLITVLQNGLSGRHSTETAGRDIWPERMLAVNNVSVSDEHPLMLSGEVQIPKHWRAASLDFNIMFINADGERMPIKSFNAKAPPDAPHENTSAFCFSLSPELEKIKGRKGTLRVNVSGQLTWHNVAFRAAPLAMVPLSGKQWTVVEKTRVLAVKPNLTTGHRPIIRLLLVGGYMSGRYAYALCDADGEREIKLGIIHSELLSDFGGTVLNIVDLTADGLEPVPLDEWKIYIQKNEPSPSLGHATFKIPDFSYSGD